MQLIGFNFTKVSAEKISSTKNTRPEIQLDFTDLDKDKIEMLKDKDILRVLFKYMITYISKEDKKGAAPGSITLLGAVSLSASQEESKEILKAWKKKEIPSSFQIPLYNTILRKCTLKAANLQEDLSLPITLPLPKVGPK